MKIKMEVNNEQRNENSDINNPFPALLFHGIIEIVKIMVMFWESKKTSENTSN